MSASDTTTIFTEVFAVITANLPKLFAYTLSVGGGDASIIGGKLSYRLRRVFGGHWVWTGNRVVTDTAQNPDEIMKVVERLWHEQSDVFKDLRAVPQDTNWRPSPQAQADFVARGLFGDIESEIRRSLAQHTQDVGNALVERLYEPRGWVVQGDPAVSISVSSRLIHKQDLTAYATGLPKPESLIGTWVADKTSSLKGEVIEITGRVHQHRTRLLAVTQREEMQEIISAAPDEELVVRIEAGRNEYDYVVSALSIVVRTSDWHRFKINPQQGSKALRIEPRLRAQLVQPIADLVKSTGLVGDGYNSRRAPHLFLTANRIGFEPQLRFGGNQLRQSNPGSLLSNLRDCGLYRRSEQFHDGVPIKIGVIDALNVQYPDSFWAALEQQLAGLDFQVETVGVDKLTTVSRADLEKAVERLRHRNPDILLAFFPYEYEEDEDEWGAYEHFKSLTIGNGIPSQVVYESTLSKRDAVANIVLGILGKTGNIPFVLAEPLRYADLVVGIDIARERKRHLPGSISATAMARIYFGSGEFLRYVIHDIPLEGETIPEGALQALFPIAEFQGKKVVVHRDGFFRGQEKQQIKDWAQRIGAQFYLVEVVKTGTPRLYASRRGEIGQPPKANGFRLSQTEAFLVSSLPPSRNATPQPLRIRTDAPLTIEQACHSVLSLTLLHYGSVMAPRLPVSIHYSDRIASLALRGIKPKELEGNIPYWL